MDELTAKALKEKNKKINQTKKVEQVEQVEKTEKTSNESIFKKSKEFILDNNTVKLGKNKTVKIKPWTGKTKKKFRKIFEYVENPEDIDFEQVMNVLLYSHIDLKDPKKEIYLNEGEQQLLISILTDKSINNVLSIDTECPECNNINNLNINILDSTLYKENTLPVKFIKDDKNDIEFVDISSLDELKQEIKNIMESEDYDGITTPIDIETAMHIKKNDLSTENIIDYLDDLSIKEVDSLMNSLNENLPQTKITKKHKCEYCNKISIFNVEIIQSIFESLLK